MSTRNANTGRPGMTGFTLVELVMYIVIVSVGVAGILSVMTYTSGHSADPMIRQQSLLIAEAYMQEILIKPFVATGVSNVCATPPAARQDYAQVCDFNGLSDSGAKGQLGTAIAGLENYNVAVTVSGGTAISLGPASNLLTNTGSVKVLKVDVTVTSSQAPDMQTILTGYRVSFNCSNASDAGCKPL